MRKVISEKGKKAIETFVKENLSGRVNETTVQAYIDMAKSNMDIHGGLPSLEISMCFSLTGDEECLELEKDDVAYEDCVFDDPQELAAVFGEKILDALSGAVPEEKDENPEGFRPATVKVPFDGYDFRITAVKKNGNGKNTGADLYRVEFLGAGTGKECSD